MKRKPTSKGVIEGDRHSRKHDVGNPYDHNIPDEKHWGKVQRVNPDTGKWEWVDIGEQHDRQHQMDSEDDHAPATGENKGKIIQTNIDTGKWEYGSKPTGDKELNVAITYKKEEIINHGLGKKASVAVYHENGEIGLCKVTYIDTNTVKLDFVDWFTGYATFN